VSDCVVEVRSVSVAVVVVVSAVAAWIVDAASWPVCWPYRSMPSI